MAGGLKGSLSPLQELEVGGCRPPYLVVVIILSTRHNSVTRVSNTTKFRPGTEMSAGDVIVSQCITNTVLLYGIGSNYTGVITLE